MKNIVLLLCLAYFFSSCHFNATTSQTTPTSTLEIKLSDDSLFTIKGEDIFKDSPRFIPLETKEECLITQIDKLIRHQSNYYILDKNQNIIFHYDKNGRYLGKLDRRGQGPEEYYDLIDFQIEGDKLYAMPFSKAEIKIYQLPDFSYSGKISLSDTYTSFLIDKEYIYLFTGQNSNSLTNIHVMDRKTKEIGVKYAGYNKGQIVSSIATGYLSNNQGQFYATFPNAFRISRLTPEKEDTLLLVKFEEDKLFPKELREKSGRERQEYCLKNNKWPISGIKNIICMDKYYIFSFVYANIEHTVFYSRLNNKAEHIGALWSSNKYWYLMQRILACYNDELIQSIDASHVCYGRTKGHAIETLKNIKEDDNPVLVIYQLK